MIENITADDSFPCRWPATTSTPCTTTSPNLQAHFISIHPLAIACHTAHSHTICVFCPRPENSDR
ncbi:MAG: hypothetical protein IPL28_04320 [Chloroflexi bacterium]|nr:hypothetical protein [Chloroflexota bacterium]